MILLKVGAIVIAFGLAATGGFFLFIEDHTPEPRVHDESNFPGGQYLPVRPDREPATRVPVPDLDDCGVDEMANVPTDDGFVVVKRVIDGDTISGEQMTENIRLWGIDAPELDQPGGLEAMAYLSTLLFPGTIVKTQETGVDQYGRVLAILGNKKERSINFKMVWEGWAFPYTGPNNKNPCLEVAARHARLDENGLWGKFPNGGERPWQWRNKNR